MRRELSGAMRRRLTTKCYHAFSWQINDDDDDDVCIVQRTICDAFCHLLLVGPSADTNWTKSVSRQQQQQQMARLAFFILLSIQPPKSTDGRRSAMSLVSNYSAWGRRLSTGREHISQPPGRFTRQARDKKTADSLCPAEAALLPSATLQVKM